jgi:hypothetical protein
MPSAQLSAGHPTAHLQSTGCTESIHSSAVDQTTPEECNLPLVKLQSWLLGHNMQTGIDNELGMIKTFNKYVYVFSVVVIS